MADPTSQHDTRPADRDDPLALAVSVRPQTYGRAQVEKIKQPVVEPLWTGLRVIGATRDEEARLFDDGDPVEGHDDILRALAVLTSRTSDGTILDGYLTKQVVSDDAVVYHGYEDELPSTGKLIAQSMIGVRRNRTEEAARRLEAEREARTFGDGDPVNLVLTDLLWLDGEWLLDVPLLERKRLLEAVVPAERLVRPGTYVVPPIQTWIGSWRAQGFTGVSFKGANSRYRPGERADDWATSDMPRR